jgi:site-specific DNA-methyltransferase (adenine-specific)
MSETAIQQELFMPDKKLSRVLFSHNKDEWSTPKDLLDKLENEFGEFYDPCPITWKPGDPDGLKLEWGDRNFVNPPYSQWQEWVKKGYEEYLKGKLVVFLLPARTDTKAFHNFIMRSNEIRFIKGRLRFGCSENSAPFPSMLVIFDPGRGEIKPVVKSYF